MGRNVCAQKAQAVHNRAREWRKILPWREYNYGGVIVDNDGKDTKDIKRRIQQGRTEVKRLNGLRWSKNISKHINLRVYNKECNNLWLGN